MVSRISCVDKRGYTATACVESCYFPVTMQDNNRLIIHDACAEHWENRNITTVKYNTLNLDRHRHKEDLMKPTRNYGIELSKGLKIAGFNSLALALSY